MCKTYLIWNIKLILTSTTNPSGVLELADAITHKMRDIQYRWQTDTRIDTKTRRGVYRVAPHLKTMLCNLSAPILANVILITSCRNCMKEENYYKQQNTTTFHHYAFTVAKCVALSSIFARLCPPYFPDSSGINPAQILLSCMQGIQKRIFNIHWQKVDALTLVCSPKYQHS